MAKSNHWVSIPNWNSNFHIDWMRIIQKDWSQYWPMIDWTSQRKEINQELWFKEMELEFELHCCYQMHRDRRSIPIVSSLKWSNCNILLGESTNRTWICTFDCQTQISSNERNRKGFHNLLERSTRSIHQESLTDYPKIRRRVLRNLEIPWRDWWSCERVWKDWSEGRSKAKRNL